MFRNRISVLSSEAKQSSLKYEAFYYIAVEGMYNSYIRLVFQSYRQSTGNFEHHTNFHALLRTQIDMAKSLTTLQRMYLSNTTLFDGRGIYSIIT